MSLAHTIATDVTLYNLTTTARLAERGVVETQMLIDAENSNIASYNATNTALTTANTTITASIEARLTVLLNAGASPGDIANDATTRSLTVSRQYNDDLIAGNTANIAVINAKITRLNTTLATAVTNATTAQAAVEARLAVLMA